MLNVTYPQTMSILADDARQLFGLRVPTEDDTWNFTLDLELDEHLPTDGFRLGVEDNGARLAFSDLGGGYAGLGYLLREADWSGKHPEWTPFTEEQAPDLPLRHLLIPGHFGNSYECMGRQEMRDFLLDMRLSGGNGYVDRFDLGELTNPFKMRGQGCSRQVHSVDLLQRKVRHWLNAQALGMDTGITLNPNHVYIEQWSEELSAQYGGKYVGNLLCPSNPQARDLILENWRELFSYLADCGVKLSHIRPAPFDDGGCACEECSPYYRAFLELTADIAPSFLEHWPDIEGYLSGWWTTAEEQTQLHDFCQSGKAAWLKHYLFSTGYDTVEMPRDLNRRLSPLNYSSFIHCAFTKSHADKYNAGGLHVAPKRLGNLLRQYPEIGCNGFMAYSEGIESHLNLHLANRTAFSLNGSPHQELCGYCRWYFGADRKTAEELADIIAKAEAMEPEAAQDLSRRLDKITKELKVLPGREYLLTLLESQLKLLDLEFRAQTQPDKIPVLAEEFAQLYEHVARYVWRTGPMRHVLTEADRAPSWVKQHWLNSAVPDRSMHPFQATEAKSAASVFAV